MKKNLFLLFCIASQVWGGVQYFPGELNEQGLKNPGQIELLTWNILGLPNEQVAVRPWEERIDQIAAQILKVDADLVLLQECFVKELSLGLQQRLKKKYGHSYLHLDAEGVSRPSGLALFSKLPLDQVRFTPHEDLLDGDANSNMGTLDFLVLDSEKKPIAHIAGSHFLGSSNCEWRVGITKDGNRLSYAQVRENETIAALKLLRETDEIPSYLCGDLNVDRRSVEFVDSSLNTEVCPSLSDPMTLAMKTQGTNTSFWKHEKGILQLYPDLSEKEAVCLALCYKDLYLNQIRPLLSQDVWTQNLDQFDSSYFSTLKEKLKLETDLQKKAFEYFQYAARKAISYEEELWKNHDNPGQAPAVSIGRVLEIRALPIEESLDYVLGTNEHSKVGSIVILKGYDDASAEDTLSDHHPVVATLHALGK